PGWRPLRRVRRAGRRGRSGPIRRVRARRARARRRRHPRDGVGNERRRRGEPHVARRDGGFHVRALPLLPLVLGVASLSCTVGEGEGWVRSDRLYIQDCVNGTFDLGPDFFGANSFRGDALQIRVQRGDNIEELSDGLMVLVNDLPTQRARIGQPISVGMPVGVSPPGVPIVYNKDPPPVSLALYLHRSCHVENATVYSID